MLKRDMKNDSLSYLETKIENNEINNKKVIKNGMLTSSIYKAVKNEKYKHYIIIYGKA